MHHIFFWQIWKIRRRKKLCFSIPTLYPRVLFSFNFIPFMHGFAFSILSLVCASTSYAIENFYFKYFKKQYWAKTQPFSCKFCEKIFVDILILNQASEQHNRSVHLSQVLSMACNELKLHFESTHDAFFSLPFPSIKFTGIIFLSFFF